VTKPQLIECIFCGDKGAPRGKEDVFPLWLAKKLAYVAEQRHPGSKPTYLNYNYEHIAALQHDEFIDKKVTGAIPAVFKLPDVCVACNGGWMGRLEEAARLEIVGLLAGKPKLLAPYDQFILAAWMVKTCLTYDASREPRHISDDSGSRRFFRLGQPLPFTNVNIGHDPDHLPEGVLVHARAKVASVAPELDAVFFAFQFDHLVLVASINYAKDLPEDGSRRVIAEAKPPYSERLWPPRDRFRWPSDVASVRRDSATPAGGAS
jgi:hypothetical protein